MCLVPRLLPWDFVRLDMYVMLVSSSTERHPSGGGTGTIHGGDGIPVVALTSTSDSRKDVGCHNVVRCGMVSTQTNGWSRDSFTK